MTDYVCEFRQGRWIPVAVEDRLRPPQPPHPSESPWAKAASAGVSAGLADFIRIFVTGCRPRKG